MNHYIMIIFDIVLVVFSKFCSEFAFYADANLGHKVRVILWIVLHDLNSGEQMSVIPPRDPTYAIIRISCMQNVLLYCK